MGNNYYCKIQKLLGDLKKSYPQYNMGKHLATCLDEIDIRHLWGIDDKLLYAKLKDYKVQLELDVPHDESEIDDILKDGMKLTNIFDNDIEGFGY